MSRPCRAATTRRGGVGHAPAVPDLTQTPVVASPYAWRGLLAAIAAAAGVEVTQTQAPLSAREYAPAAQLALLLVEDHPINQVVMREQLENLGQKVDLASDGPEALLMASGRHYDLVLTDLQMPGMDGFTLARRLRDAALPRRSLPSPPAWRPMWPSAASRPASTDA